MRDRNLGVVRGDEDSEQGIGDLERRRQLVLSNSLTLSLCAVLSTPDTLASTSPSLTSGRRR